MLKRYGKPGKYDHAPYGSVCKVRTADKNFILYIQLDLNEDNPRWECIGEFSDTTPDAYIRSAIDQLLQLKI